MTGQHTMTICTPQSCAQSTGVDGVGVRADFHVQTILPRFFLQSLDQPGICREAACNRHLAMDINRPQQLRVTAGHGKMNAFENVGRGDSPADHVDHIGLRQDRADAADHLWIASAAGERSNVLQSDTKVTGNIFQELAGAGSALAGHAVAEYAAALVNAHGARVQGPDVENGADFRHKKDRTARMGGHAVEVSSAKIHQLAFAGAGHIANLLRSHARRAECRLVSLIDYLAQLAAPYALGKQRKHLGLTAAGGEEYGNLHRAGTYIDASGNLPLRRSSPRRNGGGRHALSCALRQANKA